MTDCLLFGYGRCQGPIQGHHWINRGKLRGNKAALKYIHKHAWFFIQPVCASHNVSRVADTKWARKVILKHLVVLYGEAKCREMLEGIPWKIPCVPLSFDGIMAGPDKEMWGC